MGEIISPFLDNLEIQLLYSTNYMDSPFKELHKEGTALFDEGKYSEAEPLLREFLLAYPNYADVLNKIGVISHLSGHLKEAAGFFERALSVNPRYTEASLNLAITCNEMGDFSRAQEVFAKAAQIAHPTPEAMDPFVSGKFANEHYRLGNAYMDFGMPDEAIQEYRKALRLNGSFSDVRTKLAIALRSKGLYEEAEAELKTAKELKPNYGPASVQLGLTYYMRGENELARKEWEDAIRAFPDLQDARTYLRLLRKKG
ncbi:MAG: tetratricopeptide repeat protein [Nitrospiraceae bacterium]|nr:tetratricopeptide repeat protein [Nitrospiraceae bacterium]